MPLTATEGSPLAPRYSICYRHVNKSIGVLFKYFCLGSTYTIRLGVQRLRWDASVEVGTGAGLFYSTKNKSEASELPCAYAVCCGYLFCFEQVKPINPLEHHQPGADTALGLSKLRHQLGDLCTIRIRYV